MNSVFTRTSLFLFFLVPLCIFVIVCGPCIGLDFVFAQGQGQGISSSLGGMLGLGSLNIGALSGMGMITPGIGLSGILPTLSPLTSGVQMGGAGLMNPGITGILMTGGGMGNPLMSSGSPLSGTSGVSNPLIQGLQGGIPFMSMNYLSGFSPWGGYGFGRIYSPVMYTMFSPYSPQSYVNPSMALPGGYGYGYSPQAYILGNNRGAFSNTASELPSLSSLYNLLLYGGHLMNVFYPYTWTPISSLVIIGKVSSFDTRTPLQGVGIAVLTLDNVKAFTDENGLYRFNLPPGYTYNFIFSKEGYEADYSIQNKKIDFNLSNMGFILLPDIYLKPKKPQNPYKDNYSPQLDTINPIEVLVGESIEIKPNAIDLDPNEILTFTYSGWMNTSAYTPTEGDIGVHKVTVTVYDRGGRSDSQEVIITVYKQEEYAMTLYVGFSLISYPFENGDPNFIACDLLNKLGGSHYVYSIESYYNDGDSFLKAFYDPNGNAQGCDFPIQIGEGYVVYSKEYHQADIYDRYTGTFQKIDLNTGMNIVGIASYPQGYTSFNLLEELGYEHVDSINRYDAFIGEWESTYWLNERPGGDEFLIEIGEGYVIQMKTDQEFTVSRQRLFTF